MTDYRNWSEINLLREQDELVAKANELDLLIESCGGADEEDRATLQQLCKQLQAIDDELAFRA